MKKEKNHKEEKRSENWTKKKKNRKKVTEKQALILQTCQSTRNRPVRVPDNLKINLENFTKLQGWQEAFSTFKREETCCIQKCYLYLSNHTLNMCVMHFFKSAFSSITLFEALENVYISFVCVNSSFE